MKIWYEYMISEYTKKAVEYRKIAAVVKEISKVESDHYSTLANLYQMTVREFRKALIKEAD